MNTFTLDKNCQRINFEEVSVDELDIISGGSGNEFSYGGVAASATYMSTVSFAIASFPGTWAVPGAGPAFVTVGLFTGGVATMMSYYG